ncbi:sugar ABC transporter substrate-binding protein [Caballeronia humi]|uniref:D-ribose transporter subunit RbsB n=1 Tax=Caballeronia humi TaxID=326474 RepID=A0A158IPJ8_9BURK|nr:sugar ABC transporter substrate-binding protein [Caballeronia humi]SAL58129.1 D-ribose transporter subunit RbsB [Caballeronia humi]
MQNILQAHPAGTIDPVFAANGQMDLGALQAIRESSRSGEIKVLGLDGQKEEFEAIRADGTTVWARLNETLDIVPTRVSFGPRG